jgi:hypothetical protein
MRLKQHARDDTIGNVQAAKLDEMLGKCVSFSTNEKNEPRNALRTYSLSGFLNPQSIEFPPKNSKK